MVQVVCQDKKVVVAEAKTSCEQLLVAIVQDKRIADEQERQVSLLNSQSCHSTAWPHGLQCHPEQTCRLPNDSQQAL